MGSIVIPTGKKTYDIKDENGNVRGQIEFMPGDLNLFRRLSDLENLVEDIKNKIQDPSFFSDDEDSNYNKMLEADKAIKNGIDEAFMSNVSEIVFGKASVFNIIDGMSYLDIFMTAVLPLIAEDIKVAHKESAKAADKYISQVQ